MAEQTQEQAIAEIWQLFRETSAQIKETDAFLSNRFRETDERFRETDARLDARFAETDARLDARFAETDARLDERFRETDARLDARFAETDARLDERFRETDARLDARFAETDARLDERFRETDEHFRETDARLDARFRETDAKIRSAQGLFTSQWGKMIEALVQPNALKLFQERGIQVRYMFPRAKSELNGKSMEVDLILEDGDDVVVLEAKSTLGVEDVRDLLDDLTAFTTFFPKYKGYRIYGAVAGLNIVEQADRFAYKQGLYVLSVAGDDMVKIMNDTKFQPHNFGQVE